MGIYAWTTDEKQGDLLVRSVDGGYGMTVTTVYQPILVIENRTTCYCCSCGDREGSDPYCRNHGWAGTRPCEQHGMSGKVDDDGVMPVSVQQKRAKVASR